MHFLQTIQKTTNWEPFYPSVTGMVPLQTNKQDWLQLIKQQLYTWFGKMMRNPFTRATRHRTITVPKSSHAVIQQQNQGGRSNHDNNQQPLNGQTILCIGGRASLYADYYQLIKSAGGQLMIFRNSTRHNLRYLATLLADATSVICPVDCVKHEDFFMVHQYCQCVQKLCVTPKKSDLASFQQAVNMLIQRHQFSSFDITAA